MINIPNEKTVFGCNTCEAYKAKNRFDGYKPKSEETSKREFGITISSFAKEISTFNHYSFPKEIRLLGCNLLIAFAKGQIADMESKSEIKKLKQEQSELFAKICTSIIKWYNTTVPNNAKNKWETLPTGHGPALGCQVPDYFVDKFYFISQRAFDYLLPE